MNTAVIIIAVLLILGLAPFFILIRVAAGDLRETKRKIKQNEKELRKMICGNKEV